MGATRSGAVASDVREAYSSRTAALGRRIHDLRAARGFSLQEFALLAGLSTPVMAALERGEDDAPLVALIAAAEALELSLDALVADAPVVPAEVVAPVPHPQVAPVAPAGYVPLEMPDLWEPPSRGEPASVPPPRAAPVAPVAPVVPQGPVPRTFADLRAGALAGRTFATLPEFAVAAVAEGGHPVAVVASIFRVPLWRLETWITDSREHAKGRKTGR